MTETLYSSHTHYFPDFQMLELHYPTLPKSILKHQYQGNPTFKLAFGNGNGTIFENSSLHDVTMAKITQTTKLPSSPPALILSMIVDHNIDVQSVFAWAFKVVRKCESKHWFFPVVQMDGWQAVSVW